MTVLNDVVLNQVLVRVADDDAATEATIAAVQRDGTCWMGAHALAGPRGDADLDLELVDDRGRRRPLGGGDPRRRRRRQSSSLKPIFSVTW